MRLLQSPALPLGYPATPSTAYDGASLTQAEGEGFILHLIRAYIAEQEEENQRLDQLGMFEGARRFEQL